MAAVLGTARDAEVLADRYQRALDELPREVVRGPIRERLVDGAHQRYRAGLRKSLSAMRSERYFRLLDALDGLVAAESAALAVDEEQLAEATIEDGYKRVRKRAKAAAAADAERHDAALHRIRKSAKRLRYTAAAAGAKKVSDAAIPRRCGRRAGGPEAPTVGSRTRIHRRAPSRRGAGDEQAPSRAEANLLPALQPHLGRQCALTGGRRSRTWQRSHGRTQRWC